MAHSMCFLTKIKGEIPMAQKTTKTFTEIYMGIRKDWGEINPVTRIIPNKKAYNRKRKHKNKDWE